MGNFTAASLVFALYLAAGMLVGMAAREYARAWTATRSGDPTPRLWGRLSWHPKAWFEPFGSGILAGLILVLWAAGAGFRPPPVAYGKPAPVDPSSLKGGRSALVWTSVAGSIANVATAALAGLILRLGVLPIEGVRVLVAIELTSLSLAIFHLLPIPGLDGARIVGTFLPPNVRETYRSLGQYLPLFVLVVLFLLAGPVQSIVYSLADAFCNLFSGVSCTP